MRYKKKILTLIISLVMLITACGEEKKRTSYIVSSDMTAVAASETIESVSSISDINTSTTVNNDIIDLKLSESVEFEKTGSNIIKITKENCSSTAANSIVEDLSRQYTLFTDLDGKSPYAPDRVIKDTEYSFSAHYFNKKGILCLMYVQYNKDQSNPAIYNLSVQMQTQIHQDIHEENSSTGS